MTPNRNEQTNIKLTEKRKQRWTEAAEEEGRSLSNFIRYAVEQQLNGEGQISTQSAANGVSNDQIDDLLDYVVESLERTQRIENDLSRLHGRLNAIEKEVGNGEPIEGLNSEVYGLLPKKKDLPDSIEEWTFSHPIELLIDGRVRTGKPEHITKWLNESIDPPHDTDPEPILDREVSVAEVEQAITQLRNDLHTIQEHKHGGYYRE